MKKLSSWLVSNYLQANEDKTQAIILGNSYYRYDLEFAGTPVDIKDHLKILGICLDNNLSFKEHIKVLLKKVYAEIGALRRLKGWSPLFENMAGVEQGNFDNKEFIEEVNMSAFHTVKITKIETKRLTDGKNRGEI